MADSLRIEDCTNTVCPWTGKPVSANALTSFNDQVSPRSDGHQDPVTLTSSLIQRADVSTHTLHSQVVGFSSPEDRDKFDEAVQHFRRPQYWENRWKSGVSKGEAWDMNCPSPCLVQLCKNGQLPAGRALVPGMGRGYACVQLAMDGSRDVTGLDISASGIAQAEDHLAGLAEKEKPLGSIQYVRGDFFKHELQPFEVIYDYTFLCALQPKLRKEWAKRMASLLKPGGVLVTMIFPICDKPDGPPFAMSIELVKSLLEPVGFSAKFLEKLPHGEYEPHAGRDGSGRFSAHTALGLWVKSE